jgi:hypothetical protein
MKTENHAAWGLCSWVGQATILHQTQGPNDFGCTVNLGFDKHKDIKTMFKSALDVMRFRLHPGAP